MLISPADTARITMAKPSVYYVCTACGTRSLKWQGQCSDCGAWNSLTESTSRPPAAREATPIHSLADIDESPDERLETGVAELDRVLGGGIVPGSAALIGGDPGIGKSTLMLQALANLAGKVPALYVSAEESAAQIAARARRLGLAPGQLSVLVESRLEQIIGAVASARPRALVVDSIQMIVSPDLPSAAGSVAQVRECAQRLISIAKATGLAVFLIGHVTKEGSLAGPRVLEHMVDTVLYFQSEVASRYRIVRAVKNRYGPVSEIGVFAMTAGGLKEIQNPSAMFLSGQKRAAPGSVVTVAREGSRSLLVEIQALVDDTQALNPRRITVGLEQNRLAMLLAALHRHVGVTMGGQDVFINVVGGLRIDETAADLPAMLASVSSLRDSVIPCDTVAFGEIGLSGELRPVSFGTERLQDAVKHGFRRAIVPEANAPKQQLRDIKVVAAATLAEAIEKTF